MFYPQQYAFRLMKRTEDNALVSPYTIPPLLFTSITANKEMRVIPYGFAFSSLEKAKIVMNQTYPVYSSKLEIWRVSFKKAKEVNYEYNLYQLHQQDIDDVELIGECFFKNKALPFKVGCTVPPSQSLFCRKIRLVEKIDQNY